MEKLTKNEFKQAFTGKAALIGSRIINDTHKVINDIYSIFKGLAKNGYNNRDPFYKIVHRSNSFYREDQEGGKSYYYYEAGNEFYKHEKFFICLKKIGTDNGKKYNCICIYVVE